jgi:hypothetical protein
MRKEGRPLSPVTENSATDLGRNDHGTVLAVSFIDSENEDSVPPDRATARPAELINDEEGLVRENWLRAFSTSLWEFSKALPCHWFVPDFEIRFTVPDNCSPYSAGMTPLTTCTSCTASILMVST